MLVARPSYSSNKVDETGYWLAKDLWGACWIEAITKEEAEQRD